MLVDGFQHVLRYVDTGEADIDDSTLDQNWHNIEENYYIDLVSFDLQYLSSQLHLWLLYVKQRRFADKKS